MRRVAIVGVGLTKTATRRNDVTHPELMLEAVNAALELPLSKGLEYEKELFLKCWATEDRLEGVRAFLEKRKPVYRGK
mgnify:CR=1 FL=1